MIRQRHLVVSTLCALAAAAISLSACSARNPVVAPAPIRPAQQAGQEALPPPTGFGSWLYTCDTKSALCSLYTVVGTTPTFYGNDNFTGNPSGSFATTAGQWYVAERTNAVVAVYKSTSAGPSGPNTLLSDPGNVPNDVAVNTAHGIVAVADVYTDSGGNRVPVYVNGATSPTRILHFNNPNGNGFGGGIATDGAGNCYYSVSSVMSKVFYVVEFTGCNGSPKIVFTSSANDTPGGLALDGSNNLYFVDVTSQSIYRCTGTSSCHVIAKGFTAISTVRFDKGWRHLWTTDDTTEYLYAMRPATGHIITKTRGSYFGNGMALAPGPSW